MAMTDEVYEQLLILLAADESQEALSIDEGEIEDMVVEAASLVADIRMASGDMAGAAVWRQVIDDSSRPIRRPLGPGPAGNQWLEMRVGHEIYDDRQAN